MKKIKILQTVTDSVKGGDILAGTVIDLGEDRNKKAVEGKLAVWVDSREFEAAKKEVENQTEKKEGTPAKTTTTVKGKKIQTK